MPDEKTSGTEPECRCGCIEWVAHVADLPDPGCPHTTALGVWQSEVETGQAVWQARVVVTRYRCESLEEIEVRRGPVERLVKAGYRKDRSRARTVPVIRSVTVFGLTVYYFAGLTYPAWGPWTRAETDVGEAGILRPRNLDWCATTGVGC